ncbi:P13 family porin [Borrelia miyamotoi]|uniref:P13 family porin n=1 Tax=Borrelia miyamotoi TaxID=47466 RepID=A0AAX3JNG9_9SPIR|nr:P13 family porin [Borrelia miyamotoi]QFP42255.1 P13 family porin [Borrelia miyamotoi]QFP48369.1 P13 family porin [Borrelia miyamotoi]QGT56129.1 P13 family porin [Borrelia miyamotoi]QGT56909.1 P13 family porin [Borrelia miyamotoi]WAZ72175.1 P13 family porin [Borrelia miyamotoi]
MKRMLILMLFLLCSFVGFAQSDGDMISESGGSVGIDNFLFYESNKKTALIPALLNATVGFGIGTFTQGDILAGLFLLGTDALGVSLLTYGLFSRHQFNTLTEAQQKTDPGQKKGTIAVALIAIGAATMGLTRIVGVIIPFTYAYSFNKRLQKDLGIELGGFKPTFDVNFNEGSTGGLGLELAFVKKY